jgi:nucleotide-binding universal stress UspA family protein
MFKKILAAVETPLQCRDVIQTAIRFARWGDVRVYILHVLEPALAMPRNRVTHFQTGEQVAISDLYKEKVKGWIGKHCIPVLEKVPNHEFIVTTGLAWEEILRLSGRKKVALIVMGPHTQKSMEDQSAEAEKGLGGTLEKVLRRAHCPVMIVNRPVPAMKTGLKKIMVCIDFSPSCIVAFRFSIRLAQAYGSTIFLYHMLPIPPQPEYTQKKYDSDTREMKEKLDHMSQKIPDYLENECVVSAGVHPHLEILKFAQNKEVELIVMGSHTKMNGSKWYVGSAVKRVSIHSSCPAIVLTVQDALEKWKDA